MAFGESRWSARLSELRLPRPRLFEVDSLDSKAAEVALMDAYTHAVASLPQVSSHRASRAEAVADYAMQLERYSRLLATHAALADVSLMSSSSEGSSHLRAQLIQQVVSNPTTCSHGLAASLSDALRLGALATALTAFAVNNPSRQSYDDAAVSLRTTDMRLAEFELLERTTR